MTMKIWCDRCGKEIPRGVQNTAWTDGIFIVGTYNEGRIADHVDNPLPDLCMECQHDIIVNGRPHEFKDDPAEPPQPNTCTP